MPNSYREEREAFFDQRPGGRDGGVCLQGNRIFWEDGAVAERAPGGCIWPPPEDKFERQKNIVKYIKERTRRAVKAFVDERNNQVGMVNYVEEGIVSNAVVPDESMIANLKALRLEARGWQTLLANAESELQRLSTPENSPALRREMQMTSARQQAAHARAKIDDVMKS